MHDLLRQWLKKLKIKDVSGLSEEEKETFDTWSKTLSEGEITVERIEEFCQNQIEVIESQWRDMNNSERKNERLIVLHTVYSTLLKMINAPKQERANLERYLRQLLTSKE